MPATPEERKDRAGSFRKNAGRIGVVTIAAAFVAPMALPAFASTSDTTASNNASLSSLVSENAQDVAVEQTAGLPGIESISLDATTPEELQEIRDEIAAAETAAQEAAAEEAAAEEEAAASEDTATTSDAGSGAETSGTDASSTDETTAGGATQAAAGSGSSIANAALAQLGEIQDCTQLVADSLAAVGISYAGMGGLFNLGPTITQSQATPGDIIYYANGGFGIAHVAVYIGGGQAVHGGWAGNQTVIAGVNVGGSAPVFIDVA